MPRDSWWSLGSSPAGSCSPDRTPAAPERAAIGSQRLGAMKDEGGIRERLEVVGDAGETCCDDELIAKNSGNSGLMQGPLGLQASSFASVLWVTPAESPRLFGVSEQQA